MPSDATISRKDALRAMLLTAASASLPLTAFGQAGDKPAGEITAEDLKAIEKVVGVEFSDAERKALVDDVRASRKDFEALRKVDVEQKVAPAIEHRPVGRKPSRTGRITVRSQSRKLDVRKMSDADIAFLSAAELGELVRTRQITSVRLTELYLERLRKYGDELVCVVTLTPELAMQQARRADQEIAQGRYRGPLHGLPYGIKDLFATKGIATTWGATPYEGQVPDFDATVVRKLEEAGAVLVAKLSMGSLALGDVWFRGTTKNPWNLKEGSSGSSAGSASATAAGLVAFAIGTETQGSITSPSQRCRVTGLRPSFGRVSRYGAMELSYTMDKVGPICRTAQDCALVFAAISGSDPHDPTVVDQPFAYSPRRDLRGLKIGFVPGADKLKDDALVALLKKGGATVVPHKFTPAPDGVGVVLDVECAAAFDDLTRSGKVNDVKNSPWPEFFRAARFIPAVEYVRAQRVRRQMAERYLAEFGDLDLVVDYGMALGTIVTTNQAGTPQAIIPFGTTDKGQGLSYSFLARTDEEAILLQVADWVQRQTDFHRKRPAGFS